MLSLLLLLLLLSLYNTQSAYAWIEVQSIQYVSALCFSVWILLTSTIEKPHPVSINPPLPSPSPPITIPPPAPAPNTLEKLQTEITQPATMSADTARIPATSMMSPKINGGSNGTNGANGYFSPPQSPNMAMAKKRSSMMSSGNSRVSSLNHTVRRSQIHGNNKISLVQENASVLKKKSMSELGSGVSQSTSDTSFINLVEWIRNERLATIPHKGSKWDKVLIRALYFAEQLHGFESAIQGFALESNAAAQLGYGHARLLLEVRHHRPSPYMFTNSI